MKWLNDYTRAVWRMRTDKMSTLRSIWIRFIRIVLLTSQGFTKSQVQQGASALTYYSMLGFVPMLALVVGISRGFLLEKTVKRWFLSHLREQPEIANKLFEFADQALKHASQGVVAGLGVLILFWSIIKILMQLEFVMNQVWEVRHARSLSDQFSDYLALILICPILVFTSNALTVYITAKVTEFGQQEAFLQPISAFFFPLLNLLPFILTSLLLTFLYVFMPNTRVRFLPAFYAGLIAGAFYQILQWAYLSFQIGLTSYNAIYGTFAAFPFFLIWLHLSWVIVLLGAKIAFAFQNVKAYEFVSDDFALSPKCRKILSLRIAHLAVKEFCAGRPPPNAIEISNKLSIPLAINNQLLFELVEAGILSEVKGDEDAESGYQPGRSVDQLTIKRVLDMMDARGEMIPLPPTKELGVLLKCLEAFNHQIERSDVNLPLKNI